MILTSVQSADLDPFKVKINSLHNIKLLNHGLASLEERLEMIERAEHSIDVEYFIYNNDRSGRIFSQALIKKAREGIRVRVLLDFVMVKSQFSPFYAYELEKNGIEIKYFNTTATLNLFHGQYRNHRKVLLIDSKEAITGGRNIGDEYFDQSDEFNFLDREIALSGELVGSIQKTFETVWNSPLAHRVERDKLPSKYDSLYHRDKGGPDIGRFNLDLKQWSKEVQKAQEFLSVPEAELKAIRQKGKEELAQEYKGTCENMNFHSEYPIVGKSNRSQRIIKHEISDRIKNAHDSILFDSPYFIVNEESSEALDLALSHNVKVTLLTNSLNSTDAIYVYDVFDSIIKKWIEKGMESYIYKGDIPLNYQTYTSEIAKARFGIHAKTFVFDKKDVVIGTFNFDPRSADLNAEMIVSCDNNPELARFVTEDIENRIKGSIHLDSKESVDRAEFYKTGLFKRLEYYVLKGPAYLFDYLL